MDIFWNLQRTGAVPGGVVHHQQDVVVRVYKIKAADICLVPCTEQQIQALSEIGVDCINYWLSFATLGYPDYDINQINRNELEELDQLIAWCIKYNIHLIIECCRLPEDGGLANSPRGIADYDSYYNPFPTELLYEDSEEGEILRENFTTYWEIIASRYSRLPAKYLSFCLLIESAHESEEAYRNTFIPVVEAMRKYNEDRVVFCYQSYPDGTYTCMAEIGCPIGYSFYQPTPFANEGPQHYGDMQRYHLFSLEKLSGYFDDGRTPIIFELGSPAKSISIIGSLLIHRLASVLLNQGEVLAKVPSNSSRLPRPAHISRTTVLIY